MLLFPTPYLVLPADGLVGFDAPIILKSTAMATSYGAGVWTIAVVAGELVIAQVHAIGNAGVLTPSAMTISIDGVAMGLIGSSATTGSGVFPGSANFGLIAPTTGTLEVIVNVPSPGGRACLVVVRRITGYDAATPTGVSTGPSQLSSNTLGLTSGAMNIAAPGNVVIGSVISKAVTAAAASSTTLDGVTFDKTGGTTSNDLSTGYGHKLLSAAGNFSPDISLDVADRMSGVFLELRKSP